MTERVALEQQLRQAQKMEAIGQLTGGIAHDFNNILAVIIGMTELTACRRRQRPESLSPMVKQIDESAERGAQLVQRMLAFARKQPLEPRILDLNEAVEQSRGDPGADAGRAHHRADRAGQGFVAGAGRSLPAGGRDRQPCGQRARCHAQWRPSRHRDRQCHLDEDYAAQTCRGRRRRLRCDQCHRFRHRHAAGLIERVFEPFFTTKEVGRGTGLGLSMVYGFVKQSRGHVKIYSEVGHGTSIRLYFPRAVQQQRLAGDALRGGSAAQLPTGRETILVVEDDASVRKMAVNAWKVWATRCGGGRWKDRARDRARGRHRSICCSPT